jgi:hypothetical protein
MNKHILAVAVMAGLGVSLPTAIASEKLIIRIPLKSELSNWTSFEPLYHPWSNTGGHYNCDAWNPNVNTIDYGQSFTQSRDCDQNQKRNVEIREKDSFSNQVKTVNTVEEQRTIKESESKSSVGTRRDWQSTSPTYTDWVDSGSHHSFSTWSPEPNSQTSAFTQNRDVKQPQSREEQPREKDSITGDYRNSGSTITHNRDIDEIESRTVSVDYSTWSNTTKTGYSSWSPAPDTQASDFTQSRNFTQNQTRNRIYTANNSVLHTATENRGVSSQSESRVVNVSWTSWKDTGGHYDCGAWTPATNTVGFGTTYTQTRTCKQSQERDRIYKADSANLATMKESRVQNEDETRSATGSGNWTSYEPVYGTWEDYGNAHSHSAWSPAASSQTSNFSQTRTYSQPQRRTRQNREIDTISGAVRNTGSSDYDTRNESRSESRNVVVNVSDWSNSSTSGVTAWVPSASTQTSNFNQSRSYNQHQTRTWSYTADASNIHSRNETRTLSNQNESRTVTVSAGSWKHYSNHSFGGWSPSTSTVCSGTSFTQSRNYQERESLTYTFSIGGSHSVYRDIGRSESRTANGSKTCEDWGAAPPSYTNWSTYNTSWSAYSPSASTQTSNFTQTRSSTLYQERYEQKREYDSISGRYRDVGSPTRETRTTSGSSQSRTVTVSSSTSYSDGGYGSWSPATSTVCYGSSFTQSRSYTRTTTTTYSFSIGGSHSTSSSRQMVQNRTANGSKTCEDWGAASSTHTDWSTYNTVWSAYSPSASTQTSNFTQTRSSTLYQERYEQKREYDSINGKYRNVGSPIRETRTISGTSQSRTVGVTSGSWTHSSYHSYGTWSPSASTVCSGSSFTQTRSYKQKQSKSYTFSIGGGHTVYRDVPKSQSRTASGTKSCSSTWGYSNTVGGNSKSSGAPGSCFSQADSDGYPSGNNKSGTCTVGNVHKYSVLTQYVGNRCEMTYFEQSCG